MTKVSSALQFALVVGYGAVERRARSWHHDAAVEEVEPRLWEVRAPGEGIIGYVGKPDWTLSGIEAEGRARFAAALEVSP